MGRQKWGILGSFFYGVILAAATVCAQEEVEKSGNLRLSPLIWYVHVTGNEAKFREDWWIQDEWAGGVEEFSYKNTDGNGFSFFAEGRAIVPEQDYRLSLRMDKRNMGFVQAGYTEFRKYYSGTGGFYRPFEIEPFELANDLRLDIGDIFFEAGTAFSGWPAVTARYEHLCKEGAKSLSEWGAVTKGGVTRLIFPAFKEIDEETDIFKLEGDHTTGKFHLNNQFSYETYKTDTKRFEEEKNLDVPSSETVTVSENFTHDALRNVFYVENYLNDKVYWSLGYLYSKLDGDEGFNMVTVPFGPEPFDKNWFSRTIDVEEKAHVLNFNGMVGPFRNVTFYGGFQAERTRIDGDTDAVLEETVAGAGPVYPDAIILSKAEKDSLQETSGIRFTGLPFTTLYGEAQWTQRRIDLSERETEDGVPSFERFTDTDISRQRYTLGLNTSPLPRTTLSARLRHTCRDNDYNHLLDTEPGYSAFITDQAFKMDDVSAKLNYRPFSMIQLSLMYRILAIDIDTSFDTTPPSSARTGEYDADIYSASMTFAPISRFYLTASFSYTDAKTTSLLNDVPSILTYHGDVFSAQGTAGLGVDEETNLTFQYLYNRSNNFEDNSLYGLPLGIDNEGYGFLAALSRNLTKKTRIRIRYGYYNDNEPSIGGVDDYRAHLISAEAAFRF
ncbi:MAG: hypothetical protein P8175_15255 [Deltaproteobacteria bacterium]